MRVVRLGFTGVARSKLNATCFSRACRGRQVVAAGCAGSRTQFREFYDAFFALPRMTRGNNRRVFIGIVSVFLWQLCLLRQSAILRRTASVQRIVVTASAVSCWCFVSLAWCERTFQLAACDRDNRCGLQARQRPTDKYNVSHANGRFIEAIAVQRRQKLIPLDERSLSQQK